MDGALLVAAWFASSLLVVGIVLVRGRRSEPPLFVPAMVLLGPAGLVFFVVWTLGHRQRAAVH